MLEYERDRPISTVGDLMDALSDFNKLEIRSTMLVKHPDGSPRRLVVSFRSMWEQDHPTEL